MKRQFVFTFAIKINSNDNPTIKYSLNYKNMFCLHKSSFLQQATKYQKIKVKKEVQLDKKKHIKI